MTAALATAPHALRRDCDSVYLLIGRAVKHPAALGARPVSNVIFPVVHHSSRQSRLACNQPRASPQYNKCVCFSSGEWKRATIALRAEVGSLSPLVAYRQCTIVVQDNVCWKGGFGRPKSFIFCVCTYVAPTCSFAESSTRSSPSSCSERAWCLLVRDSIVAP